MTTKVSYGVANIASQAEAEAGTAVDKFMTPERTAQAIAQQAPAETIATQPEAEAGTENTKMMTALRTAQAIAALETATVFTDSFESTAQTITAAGSLTLAHGLASQPNLYFTYIKCTTAEHNYSIGDEVPVPMNGNSNNSYGVTIVPDATNINVRFGSNAAVFQVLDKTSGASANITLANWEFYVRAWA